MSRMTDDDGDAPTIPFEPDDEWDDPPALLHDHTPTRPLPVRILMAGFHVTVVAGLFAPIVSYHIWGIEAAIGAGITGYLLVRALF